MLFKKYVDLYIHLNKSEWKPSYLDKQRGIIRNYLTPFYDRDITTIKATDIKLFLVDLVDIGNKSKRNILTVLNGIFNLAIEDEVLNKSPLIHIKNLKYKAPKINPFSADEVMQIIDKSKDYNFNFVYFLAMGFYTGMRTGEILSLKLDEVDLDNRTISINSTRSRFGEGTPKTHGSKRVIPIIDSLYPYIEKMKLKNSKLDYNNYMLVTQYSTPYRDTFVFTSRWWKPLLKELNLEYRRPYNMRHTFATNMLYKQLCTPLELAQFLGHSTTEMIYNVYVNYLNGHLNKFDKSINIYF